MALPLPPQAPPGVGPQAGPPPPSAPSGPAPAGPPGPPASPDQAPDKAAPQQRVMELLKSAKKLADANGIDLTQLISQMTGPEPPSAPPTP